MGAVGADSGCLEHCPLLSSPSHPVAHRQLSLQLCHLQLLAGPSAGDGDTGKSRPHFLEDWLPGEERQSELQHQAAPHRAPAVLYKSSLRLALCKQNEGHLPAPGHPRCGQGTPRLATLFRTGSRRLGGASRALGWWTLVLVEAAGHTPTARWAPHTRQGHAALSW